MLQACLLWIPAPQVRLYDKDYLTSDDDLGTAMLALSTLTPGQDKQVTLDLKGGCMVRGSRVLRSRHIVG
jgi:hypothetical protein